ncbi:hypothetical protein F5I97DRAFT_1886598 [Phlebopus sp. FC_14]|nr:hypothetical protein F5I97DRAFT_1886598 [Phlebopus sp. FC_14]
MLHFEKTAGGGLCGSAAHLTLALAGLALARSAATARVAPAVLGNGDVRYLLRNDVSGASPLGVVSRKCIQCSCWQSRRGSDWVELWMWVAGRRR